MKEFDHKGIKVGATVEIRQIQYKDAKNDKRTRFDRDVKVSVQFWSFDICDGDLYGLAFIKATLQYFLKCTGYRTSKSNSKIVFAKELSREEESHGKQSLYFVARQKSNEHFLHVCLQCGGKTINEVYLDVHEVMILDIAVGKVISLLAPESITEVTNN